MARSRALHFGGGFGEEDVPAVLHSQAFGAEAG